MLYAVCVLNLQALSDRNVQTPVPVTWYLGIKVTSLDCLAFRLPWKPYGIWVNKHIRQVLGISRSVSSAPTRPLCHLHTEICDSPARAPAKKARELTQVPPPKAPGLPTMSVLDSPHGDGSA